MKQTTFSVMSLLFGLSLAACSSESRDPNDDIVDVTVEGDDGVLTFEIVSEGPLAEGRNDLRVSVLHDGVPFTNCSISASVQMASMTHGASSPGISDLGGGEFLLHEVEFYMPGQWQISMYAENAEQLKIRDTAVATLDVP